MAGTTLLEQLNGTNPWIARIFVVVLALGGLEVKSRYLDENPVTRQEVESIITSQAPFIEYQGVILASVRRSEQNAMQLQTLHLEMRDAHQELREMIHSLELQIARSR